MKFKKEILRQKSSILPAKISRMTLFMPYAQVAEKNLKIFIEMWMFFLLMTFNLLQEKKEHRKNFFIHSMPFTKITNKLFFLQTDHQKQFLHLNNVYLLVLNGE